MAQDALRKLADQLEAWVDLNVNTIVDLAQRKEYIFSNEKCNDELLTPLAQLFSNAKSLYERLSSKICEPFRGHGKGETKDFLESAMRGIIGEKIRSGFAEIMDDDFDENELTMKQGQIAYTDKNICYIVSHLRNVQLVYDQFSRQPIFRKYTWPNGADNSLVDIKPPQSLRLDDEELVAPGASFAPFEGYHESQFKMYLNTHILPNEHRWFNFNNMCYAAANSKGFDLYKWWLQNCVPEWDGIDRSDWLEKYCGVDPVNHEWNKIVGMKLSFGAMVARCLEPGIHCRVVLVFEGDQNIGKSRLAAELAFMPEAFTKLDLSDGFKEAKRMIKGMAVVELADLGSVDIVNQNRMKDFISDENNRTRNMHSTAYDNEKRRSIFILTVNGDFAGFLVDVTGNTRFGVVELKGDIDIEGIRQIKMQLWAQALHEYKKGIRPWLTKEESELQTKTTQRAERYYREYELCEIFTNNNQIAFETTGVTTMNIIEACRADFPEAFSATRPNRSYCSKFIKGMRLLGYVDKPFNNKTGFKGNMKPNTYWVKS